MSAKAPEGRQSLAEQDEIETVLSHLWVLASPSRISLKEQHWIADVLISWVSKQKSHEQADEQRRKEIDERIARVEIVQEELASFCNSRKKPTFDQMDAWVLALNPAVKQPSAVVLECQEKP